MFNYEILRNRWVIITLCGGIALVLYFVIHYLDYHKPRRMKKEKPDEYETEYMNAWQAIPVSVKFTIAAILVFAVTFSIHALNNPNSW